MPFKLIEKLALRKMVGVLSKLISSLNIFSPNAPRQGIDWLKILVILEKSNQQRVLKTLCP